MSVATAIPLEDGPWTGLMDASSPTARVEGKYHNAVNVYPLNPRGGDGTLVGRPGLRVLNTLGLTSPQLIDDVYAPGATTPTLTVVDTGNIYTYDPAGGTFTLKVASAAITALGNPTWTAATNVSMLHTPQGIVVNADAAHFAKVFLWDGNTTVTALPNAPVFYGKPTYWKGRVFGIKAADQTTIVWSEADDPLTGYEAGGFTNAWQLTTTNPTPLYVIIGTNEGLILFRARSSTIADGDPSDTSFTTTTTEDGLDDAVGSMSPFAYLRIEGRTYFLNAECKPFYFDSGASSATPMWEPLRETIAAATCYPLQARMAVLDTLNLLLIWAGGTNPLWVYDIRGRTPELIGTWTTPPLSNTGVLGVAAVHALTAFGGGPLPTMAPFVAVIGGNPSPFAMVYDPARTYDESFTGQRVARTHLVETQCLGDATARELLYDRLDLTANNTAATWSLTVTTPYGASAAQTVSFTGTGTTEQHASLGLDARGRWVRVTISHTTTTELFGVKSLLVTAYPASDDPEAP